MVMNVLASNNRYNRLRVLAFNVLDMVSEFGTFGIQASLDIFTIIVLEDALLNWEKVMGVLLFESLAVDDRLDAQVVVGSSYNSVISGYA